MKKILLKSLASLTLLALPLVAQGETELRAQATKLEQKGDTRAALDAYIKAYQQNPGNVDTIVKIAKQYGDMMADLKGANRKAAAEQSLKFSQQAVKVGPNNSDAYLAMAISIGKSTEFMGNKEKIQASGEIKKNADKALQLNPKSDLAHHMLGRWHQELAGMGGVTRALAKVVYGAIPPASFEAALQQFEIARKLRPDRLLHQIEYGRTLAMMGRDAEARTELQKGLNMPNREADDAETKVRGRATLKGL